MRNSDLRILGEARTAVFLAAAGLAKGAFDNSELLTEASPPHTHTQFCVCGTPAK